MRAFMKLCVALSTVALIAVGCGGGGGNSSTGGVFFTHAELADEFVYQLNNILGYDVTLEKVNTEQFDYIVVYDWDFGTYDAYYIGAFNPGEDILNYVNFYDSDFYFDLDPLAGNRYQDPFSGVIFNQNAYFQRNFSKMEGQDQDLIVNDLSAKIAQSYSLSQTAADKLAKAAITVAVMNRRGAGEQAYRAMMEDVTGTNLDQWNSAIFSGDMSQVNQLIDTAADTLGTDSTDLRNSMGALFFNN